MRKTIEIVIGAHFGDEGKGATVSSLAKTYGTKYVPICVVRFNGGHQAGHKTHLTERKYHIAASYGSGTLLGVPTYISSYCLMSPSHLLKEIDFLKMNNISIPPLYIDPLTKITTRYDIVFNQLDSKNRSDGTVGRGIGATMKRNLQDKVPFNFIDLTNRSVYKKRLEEVKKYYKSKLAENNISEYDFSEACRPYREDEERFMDFFWGNELDIKSRTMDQVFDRHSILIFEGAQGTLLDMDRGLFFPNVTYSSTTAKNVIHLLDENKKYNFDVKFNLVTRSYLTRHGAGWFPEEHDFKAANPNFRKWDFGNISNPYQGTMKTGKLDLSLLSYSKQVNELYLKGVDTKRLVVNCLDEHEPDLPFESIYEKVIKRNSIISDTWDWDYLRH